MKLSGLLLITSLTLTANLTSLFLDGIAIRRTTSDKQIVAAESQVFKNYGFKIDIQVLSRNSDGEITNLKCICYDKLGEKGSSCSSDNFGALVIKKEGSCKIADEGYEKNIL